jgi:hypothetical protein
MLTSVGESVTTIFTLLAFLIIILAPMAMGFMRSKEGGPGKYNYDGPGTSPRRADSMSKADFTEGVKKKAKKSRDIFFELLRHAEREDEPEVTFTVPKVKADQPLQPAESVPLFRKLNTDFEEFDSELRKPFESIDSESGSAKSEQGVRKTAGLPETSASGRLSRLPELQRAIVLAELLGPPKALREDEDRF